MSEIWTAKEKVNEDGKELIIFDVLDEMTGKTHQERRYTEAIPLMLALGGYPAVMGALMQIQELPWRFRKIDNGNIYLDGSSIGADDYHPISD